MFKIPQIPDWDAMHPIVIHFPVALLMAAPMLIFVGLIVPRLRSGFYLSGLVVLILGSIGAIVSVSTGEAAAQVADRTKQVTKLITEHGHMADLTRNLYLGLTLVWGGLLLASRLGGSSWFKPKVQFVAVALFLLVNIPGSLLIANMAHVGGRLVHEEGVHAMMPKEP